MTDHHMDGLTRQAPFELLRADGDGDGLTIEGYGAVFNSPTRINNWEGDFDEVIAPGAFRKTIEGRAGRILMQYDHGQHPLIGSIPIGRWDVLEEDERGLRVRGRLHDNDLVKPVRQAIDSGALYGMSFRFGVVRDDWTDGDDRPLRVLREVRVGEVGVVASPAYEATSVGVRSIDVTPWARLLADIQQDPELRHSFRQALDLTEYRTADDAAQQGTSDVAANPFADKSARLRWLRANELKKRGIA